MITKITLHNWKSFQEATLYIDPLTVLIGLNASGKSNVVDALRFLQRSVSMPLTTAVTGTGGDAQIPEIRGGIEWMALYGSNEFMLEAIANQSDNVELKYELTVSIAPNGSSRKAFLSKEKLTSIIKKKRGGTSEHQLFWTDPCDENSENITARIKNKVGVGKPLQIHRQTSVLFHTSNLQLPNEVRLAADHLTGLLQKIYILDPVPLHMRDFCRLSDALLPDGSNAAGVIAALSNEEKVKLEEALTKHIGQLPDNPFSKINVEQVGKFRQDAMLYGTELLPGNTSIEVDARSMSDGTLRAIALLTAILTREKDSLLVIEEVDNGLHPSKAGALLKLLLELGRQQGVDILITTHNPALMDALERDLLSFISVAYRDETTGYSVIGLLEEVEKLPNYLARGSLGKIVSDGLVNKLEPSTT